MTQPNKKLPNQPPRMPLFDEMLLFESLYSKYEKILEGKVLLENFHSKISDINNNKNRSLIISKVHFSSSFRTIDNKKIEHFYPVIKTWSLSENIHDNIPLTIRYFIIKAALNNNIEHFVGNISPFNYFSLHEFYQFLDRFICTETYSKIILEAHEDFLKTLASGEEIIDPSEHCLFTLKVVLPPEKENAADI